MSEQDQHDNTPEINEEPQDTAGQGGMHNTGDANTGEGADHVEHRGEQAAQDEASVEQASAEPSAEQASTEREKNIEQKPEEAEAPEDLFDLMGPEGKKHKKKKPEPQQGAKQGQGSAQQQKEEKKFPAQAEIVYAGHRITIPREMSATEIIDELLADDFPELTKDSTEFNHDEERNRVVPTRKALKKGAQGLGRKRGGMSRPSPSLQTTMSPRA